MLTVEAARRQYDMRAILRLDGGKRKIVCPLPMHAHSSYTPSFSIFFRAGVQYFKCHGTCSVEGDVVDLIGFLRIPGYNRKDPAHTIRALELLEERWEAGVVVAEKSVELNGDEWRHFLPAGPEVMRYAATRGLNEATLWKFKLGQWKQFMTMPNFEAGRLVGIKLRRIEAGEPRFFSLKGSRLGLFNYDAVEYAAGVVLIVKGEIPCMLLDQMGYTACAPTGGEGSWRLIERWKTALALARKIVIGDNDEAGRKLGLRRSELLGGRLVFPPAGYKDIDAAVLAEPEKTRRWLDGVVAETIRMED